MIYPAAARLGLLSWMFTLECAVMYRCVCVMNVLGSTISHATTQEELTHLYTGDNLILDERYAQMLTAVFFCLMYSTGVPLLIPIAVILFVVMYWVDKFMFCRVYRTPPQYVPPPSLLLLTHALRLRMQLNRCCGCACTACVHVQ